MFVFWCGAWGRLFGLLLWGFFSLFFSPVFLSFLFVFLPSCGMEISIFQLKFHYWCQLVSGLLRNIV